jgi:hypothetical protein
VLSAHFGENLARRGDRIVRREDRTAHHEVRRAVAHGVRGSRDALLVSDRGTGGPHARRDEKSALLESLRQRADFARAADESVRTVSDGELRHIAEFIAALDPSIPWHVSAYHADYKMIDGPQRTPPERLLRAVELAQEAGLQFVYTGNIGGAAAYEDTICPKCGC